MAAADSLRCAQSVLGGDARRRDEQWEGKRLCSVIPVRTILRGVPLAYDVRPAEKRPPRGLWLQHATFRKLQLWVSHQQPDIATTCTTFPWECFLPLGVSGLSVSLLKGLLAGEIHIHSNCRFWTARQTSAVCVFLTEESASQSCVCVFIANGGRLVHEGGIGNRLSGAELLKSSQKSV